MIVTHLRICRRLDAPLSVHHVVNVVEPVLPLISWVIIVRNESNIILFHLRIVEIDLPV